MTPACPPLTALRRLLGEELSGPEREAVEAHLEICPFCQGVMDDVVAGDVSAAPAVPYAHVLLGPAANAEEEIHLLRRLESMQPPPEWFNESAAARAPSTGPGGPAVRLPDYDVVRELGRGGTGTVYLARQVASDRPVALKWFHEVKEKAPGRLDGFLAGTAPLVGLNHPNLVSVLEVGHREGRCFAATEYVEGVSLAVHLFGPPLPERAAAALVEGLAHGLAHAHAVGAVHGNLTPGNVLLEAARPAAYTTTATVPTGRGSDALRIGVPRVNDFLGAAFRRAFDLPAPSPYQAPEVVHAGAAPPGAAADVWSLGAILHQLVTGTTATEPPVGRMSPELARVCRQCLDTHPPRRPSAEEVADDLRRFREGLPVRRGRGAEPGGLRATLRRLLPRIAALAVVGVVALGSFILLYQVRSEALTARDALAAERAASEILLERAAAELYDARIDRAALRLRLGDRERARRLLDRCPEGQRGWEWRHLAAVADGGVAAWSAPEGDVAHAVGLVGEDVVALGPAGERRWLGADRRPGPTLPLPGIAPEHGAAYQADGRLLVVTAAGRDGVRRWDTATGREGELLEVPGGKVTGLALRADGGAIAVAGAAGVLWTSGAQGEARRLDTGPAPRSVSALALRADGKMLAVAITGGAEAPLLQVWQWSATAPKPREIRLPAGTVVGSLAFAPDGDTLAAGDGDRVRLLNLADGRETASLEGKVRALAFHPEGQLLAVVGDRSVTLWDWRRGVERVALGNAVTAPSTAAGATWSPDGRRLAALLGGRPFVWEAPEAGR